MDITAVANLVIAMIAAVAAVAAAIFAYKSPTQKDLQRVENHTATTSSRLEKVQAHLASVDSQLNDQRAYDLLKSKAQRVSITVRGDDRVNAPLRLRFILKDPKISLSHVELYNEGGTLFGSASCELVEPLVYAAVVESGILQRWFSGGTPDQLINRRLLRMRSYMLIDGREVYRDFAAHMTQGMRPGSDRTQPSERVFRLEADC